MVKIEYKHGLFFLKVINFKILNNMISFTTGPISKFFVDFSIALRISGTKHGQGKTKSTSNIVITYFFVLKLKKKIHIIPLFYKTLPQSGESIDDLISFSSFE